MPKHSRFPRLPLAAVLLLLAGVIGCQNGNLQLLGYNVGADALYDPNIKTVYVPMFHNRAFQTTPNRALEAEITAAVVREIASKTRFKVVSDPQRADTELIGSVVAIDKVPLNRNQQNTIRQGEVVVTVDVLWRDLRNGCILSAPQRVVNPASGIPVVPGPEPVPFDPDLPPPPPVAEVQVALPTRITAVGRLIPELGETNASARQRVSYQVATQIVSMMERQW